MNLNGKVALVLGAIKGIGKGIGLALAGEGVRLALNYWDWEPELPTMQKDFADAGADPLILRTDLTDTAAVPAMVAKVVEHYGRLDILINNIERGGWPVVHGAYTQPQWDLELATTLRAKQWVFANALPHLKAAGGCRGDQLFLHRRRGGPQRTGGIYLQRRLFGRQPGHASAHADLGPAGGAAGPGQRNHAGDRRYPPRSRHAGVGFADRSPATGGGRPHPGGPHRQR
jgi:NAD(P)-dependent dehydrogenase (short-subunit alcohol dehydrogenase family)